MSTVKEMRVTRLEMVNEVAYNPRRLRVVTIGAGFSGLMLAYKMQHEHIDIQDFVEHVIYERSDGVGGCWRANTYPGVRCDVPAHVYAFPFDPSPDWERFYADGPEILDYIEKTCDKWDLRKNIQFNTNVVSLEWLNETGRWKIVVDCKGERRVDMADFIVTARGHLSQWRWPCIPGLLDFNGHKVHSAACDHSYDCTGKRIGIIGNGSSGVQILPQMAKLPGTDVVSFIRSGVWITETLGEAYGVLNPKSSNTDQSHFDSDVQSTEKGSPYDEANDRLNPPYTQEDRNRFRTPEGLAQYRKAIQSEMVKSFETFRDNTEALQAATRNTIERMRKALNYDDELCSMIIPNWKLGCSRTPPGIGYLESFLLPNVELTQSPIIRITPTGVQTKDKHYDLDVIICATGYDMSYVPNFSVKGKNGLTLAEKWRDEPEAYLSLACPDFPNYFMFIGPNALVTHGALLLALEWTAEWMIKWLRKVSGEHIKSITPKQSVTDEYNRYGDEICNSLVWTDKCRSWLKKNGEDGRVTTAFAGSPLLYRQMIQDLRPEDFEIEYCHRNRFQFMGHGMTALEMDANADLTWYMKK